MESQKIECHLIPWYNKSKTFPSCDTNKILDSLNHLIVMNNYTKNTDMVQTFSCEGSACDTQGSL